MTPDEILYLAQHGQLPTYGARGAPNVAGISADEAIRAALMINGGEEVVDEMPEQRFSVRQVTDDRGWDLTLYAVRHSSGYWYPRRFRTEAEAEACKERCEKAWKDGKPALVDGMPLVEGLRSVPLEMSREEWSSLDGYWMALDLLEIGGSGNQWRFDKRKEVARLLSLAPWTVNENGEVVEGRP